MANPHTSTVLGLLCISTVIHQVLGLRCYYCTDYLTHSHQDPRYACRPQPGPCGAVFDTEQTEMCSAGESCYFNNDSATDFNPHSGCKKREAGPYKGDQYCDTDFCGPVGYDLQKACNNSDKKQTPNSFQGLRCYYCTEYLDTYPHPRDPRYACRPQPGACGAIFDVEQTKICKDGESCYFNNDPELGSTYIPHSGCGRKGAKKALKGDQFCDTDFCGPIGYKVKDACKGKSNGVGWKWSSRILVAIFGTLAAFSEI